MVQDKKVITTPKRGRAILRITSLVVAIMLFIVLIAMLISALSFKKENSSPSLFGNTFFIMRSKGMGDSVAEGSAVIAKEFTAGELDVNDVILYAKPDGYKAVHRISEVVRVDDGVEVYSVKGDANAFGEPELVYETAVIARVEFFSRPIGAFIVFATSLQGVFIIAVLPCLLVLLMEVFRIVRPKAIPVTDDDTEDEEDNSEQAQENETDEATALDSGQEITSELEREVKPIAPPKPIVPSYSNTRLDMDSVKLAAMLKDPTATQAEIPAKPTPPAYSTATIDKKQSPLFTRPKDGEVRSSRLSEENNRSASLDFAAKNKKPEIGKLSVDDILDYIDREEIKLKFDEKK